MRRLNMQLGVGLSFFFFQVQGRGGGGVFCFSFGLLPTCSQCGPSTFPSMFPKFPMCSLGLSQLHLDFIPHCLAIVQLPCILSYIVKDVRMKWNFPSIRLVVHPSSHPCESTPWKRRGCRLHTIPLLSLTLQLSAHQEWEGNKPGMAFHPCLYLDTSSSSMWCLLAGRCINNHHVWWIIITYSKGRRARFQWSFSSIRLVIHPVHPSIHKQWPIALSL
jgi:hypothetical protein